VCVSADGNWMSGGCFNTAAKYWFYISQPPLQCAVTKLYKKGKFTKKLVSTGRRPVLYVSTILADFRRFYFKETYFSRFIENKTFLMQVHQIYLGQYCPYKVVIIFCLGLIFRNTTNKSLCVVYKCSKSWILCKYCRVRKGSQFFLSMHFIGWPERRLEWSFPVFYFLSLTVPGGGGGTGVGDKCTEKESITEQWRLRRICTPHFRGWQFSGFNPSRLRHSEIWGREMKLYWIKQILFCTIE
jgi:hypothetical protein